MLANGQVDEIDPELVLVFDLAGTIQQFRNAIDRIEGFEFLTELLDDESEADDDFHMLDENSNRAEKPVAHSLYLVMSNAQAANQLIQLFDRWEADPTASFDRGLGKFKTAFEQLRDIRRWDVTDRIRDTGLLEQWNERLQVVGQSPSPVMVEIELWFRRTAEERAAAQSHVEGLVNAVNGRVVDGAQITPIAYHGLLVEIPVQHVQSVLREGAESIQLLSAEDIMFVSPYTPMSVGTPSSDPLETAGLPKAERLKTKPRIALLDGLPVINHDALVGRLVVDDPDSLSDAYAVSSRRHGTSMASLIIHGDLSATQQPLDRPLYVRPILQPHPWQPGYEQPVEGKLWIDLLHGAIRRIFHGDGQHEGVAPSIRIINLSIGVESRALVRRISPLGKLLDWLSIEYNVLFVVSAGNHLNSRLAIPAEAASNIQTARVEAIKAARNNARSRGILPPGDSLNALTVSATHADAAGAIADSDTVWDLLDLGMPALYGAVGPGVGRSVKPDLHHVGGRALYVKPVPANGHPTVELELANTSTSGPGNRVAAPGRFGATNATVFTHGTSNATALVTREASHIFDILESGADSPADVPFPDAQFHPVLTKALLVHACDWGDLRQKLQQILAMDSRTARRDLTALLGYGVLAVDRLGAAATNRAVLVAGGLIERDQRHTHWIPLPASLHAKAAWHRFTITLAYMAPTAGQLTKYRSAKVHFEIDDRATGGSRAQADHNSVRRGTCQHEVIEGNRTLRLADDGRLPVHVDCMDDAQKLSKHDKLRYGLVVSVETAVTTSTTIHQEIRTSLQAQARVGVRARSR
ncbi:S8 family peptidase [Nocardia higoensis]|uniref:S8 family peptidase n=1 Tax=Nocardia higoensis TaxID=228599 RepID=UPI000317398D|nr:S8 family peptidase [Nocardia higoensis]